MSVFYTSDQYQQSRKLIYSTISSICNFVVDLANIINEYFIVELRVGTKVDCKDDRGIWCIAQVMKVAEEKGQMKFYIHYCGWRKQYDEWIEIQWIFWNFDLLNAHTPVDEDLIMSPNFTGISSTPFYRECPSVLQREKLVRRISEMGLPADAVARQYEQLQWNRPPYAIFRDVWQQFPGRSVCRCEFRELPICYFCSLKGCASWRDDNSGNAEG